MKAGATLIVGKKGRSKEIGKCFPTKISNQTSLGLAEVYTRDEQRHIF